MNTYGRLVIALGSIGAMAVISCTENAVVGRYIENGSQPPEFADTSEGDAGPDAERGFTTYCPSSECPANRTTCAYSRFLCEVDLTADRRNCGACGNACPPNASRSIYECIEGRCVMACDAYAYDCDGIPDNGCEVTGLNNDHCGACGNKCTDPDKPCVQQGFSPLDVGCGCPEGKLYCPTPFPRCVDPNLDDNNCGGCGVVCDPSGDGDPPHETAYFGCYAGACGQLKCKPGRGNCDGNLANGCETNTRTADNCGGCGLSCAAGQDCRVDRGQNNKLGCMCSPGQTFCQSSCENGLCQGECFDLSSDPKNCGACGRVCPGSTGSPNSMPACNYGTCTIECRAGYADCNGSASDQCEVTIDSDPMNCGGCGKVCDAVAGQACVGGRCVVKPCDRPDQAAGEVPR